MSGCGSGSRQREASATRGAAAAISVALMALLGAAPAAAEGAGKRLIVSPQHDRAYPAKRLLVRVRAPEQTRQFRVRLNGEPIASHFAAPSQNGIRRLRLSPSHGLRHGKNRLWVRVRSAGGRERSSASRFWVRRDGPLAAAGVDRHVAVDTRVFLDARRSRSHLRSAGRGAGGIAGSRRLDYNWALVRAPRGSPSGTEVAPAGTRRASLRPRTPGEYRIRLTVTAEDGATSSDLIELVVDPAPTAFVNTMSNPGDPPGVDPHGPWGVQVGKAHYPAQDGAWAQLVAIDRTTLEPLTGGLSDLTNKSYVCSHDNLAQCQAQLKGDLGRLGPAQLAIVSNQPSSASAAGVPPLGIEDATARIGVAETKLAATNPLAPGSFSAIGVPGTKPGEGTWHSVPTDAEEGAGRIHDYLLRSNEGKYVFAPRERVGFTTRGAGSNSQTGVVEIGGSAYRAHTCELDGGFQVEVFDAQTLRRIGPPPDVHNPDSPEDDNWFSTSQNCRTTAPEALGHMRDKLKRANDAGDRLIIVTSHKHLNPTVPAVAEVNSPLQLLADEIERAGGTRNAIFRALDPGLSQDTSYTLIGSSNAGPGMGEEEFADGTLAVELNAVPLSGRLVRTGPNYSFEIEAGPTVGEPVPSTQRDPSRAVRELTETVFQAPSAWPEEGNAGRTNAVAWIGRRVVDGDIRGLFWTHPFVNGQFDFTFWDGASDSVYNRIGALSYQQTEGFTAGDLEWAKDELQREVRWLVSTHRHLGALASPFAEDQLKSWAQLQDLATHVKVEVGVSDGTELAAAADALFDATRKLSGLHTLAVIYETAMKLATIGGDSGEDAFPSRAGQIGKDLADRLEQGRALLQREMPNAIAADHQKLKTVGSCASEDPDLASACPFDHSDWQITQDDQEDAARALLTGSRYWAFSELLPARYRLWRLPPWWRTTVDESFYGNAVCFGCVVPFDGLPPTAQVAKPIYRNLPDYSHTVARDGPNLEWRHHGETWQIYALGYLTGGGHIFDPFQMHFPRGDPPVTDRLFKPPPEGLGAYPEQFFDRYFEPVPLEHFPYVDTPTGWCENVSIGCA